MRSWRLVLAFATLIVLFQMGLFVSQLPTAKRAIDVYVKSGRTGSFILSQILGRPQGSAVLSHLLGFSDDKNVTTSDLDAKIDHDKASYTVRSEGRGAS